MFYLFNIILSFSSLLVCATVAATVAATEKNLTDILLFLAVVFGALGASFAVYAFRHPTSSRGQYTAQRQKKKRREDCDKEEQPPNKDD